MLRAAGQGKRQDSLPFAREASAESSNGFEVAGEAERVLVEGRDG